jgi:hypothetical protein
MAETPRSIPGWLVDLLIALALVGIAIVVERQTQGRLGNDTIALFVGLGTLLLLRLGATLAQAGREMGCLFVFAITWVLPCASVLYVASSARLAAMVRDSLAFFTLLGFFLILIMIVTFERIRRADEARYPKA